MKKMLFQRWRLMLCGDRYGLGLWLNDANCNRSRLKNVPSEVARTAYETWLAKQPSCGHKKCANQPLQANRPPWRGNDSKYMWAAYQASFWTPPTSNP